MITYSMSQVETLTGINAHTLRVWERRYNFLQPYRTDTNIRYYSDGQLKKLLNIAILTRNGYRISKIDKMSQAEIHKLVNEILFTQSDENADRVNGLVISMLEMDEDSFDSIFHNSISESDFLSAILDLIYPFLTLVGGLWTTNKATPAQEHFITNLIRQKIIAAIEVLPKPAQDAKRILLFLLEGEVHEIGLLVAYYMAKKMGWKVYYLGQNVPSKNIDEVCKMVKPDLMMTMFITPRPQKINATISKFIAGKNIPLLISGNPLNFKDLKPVNNGVYIQSPYDFEVQLHKY